MSWNYSAALVASLVMLWNEPGVAQDSDLPPGAPHELYLITQISPWQESSSDEGRVHVLYLFRGNAADARFRVELTPASGSNAAPYSITFPDPPAPDAGDVTLNFQYPASAITDRVTVSLVSVVEGKVLATKAVEVKMSWQSREERFENVVVQINSGYDLRGSRQILERMIANDPKFQPAYIELARVAMKSDWGPESIRQGERLLDSALKLRPDSADAKILLGYVYTHQHRYREAEALFVDLAKSPPPNLWLWTNWGELLEARGQIDAALAKYRETIARPPTERRYLDARGNAYLRLIALLEQRKDLDGLEAVFKQRIAEFGPDACYSAPYARFKLNVRGDVQGAIDLARGALNLNCDDAPSREILGLASYVQWARETGAASSAALDQARIYLAPGPLAFYRLSTSEITMVAAQKLIESGEAIDQKDNHDMTALAVGLERGDLDAVQRLLQLGARPDMPVSNGVPVALLPVWERNLEAIRLLQRAGVDYRKLRYQGATAVDYAKQMADGELLEALAGKGRAL